MFKCVHGDAVKLYCKWRHYTSIIAKTILYWDDLNNYRQIQPAGIIYFINHGNSSYYLLLFPRHYLFPDDCGNF